MRRQGHDGATHHVSGRSDDPSFSAFIICICYHAAARTRQTTSQVRIGAPHRMSKRVPELSNPAPHASYREGVGYWELHGSAHRVSVVRLGLT